MLNPSDTPTVPIPEPKADLRSKAGIAPIKAFVSFTEIPGSNGGFTIGMGLHGAKFEAENPDAPPQPVSIVDVLALAVTHIVRTQPEAFRQSFALVKQTLQTMNEQTTAGVSGEDVVAAADEALGGAISQGLRG